MAKHKQKKNSGHAMLASIEELDPVVGERGERRRLFFCVCSPLLAWYWHVIVTPN